MPGIGLHAIKKKHQAKEEKALGGKTKNPKFEYQRDIMEHFLNDEKRFKAREREIFEQMEDLLDDERIRKNCDKMESSMEPKEEDEDDENSESDENQTKLR